MLIQSITYRLFPNYKYQLVEDASYATGIFPATVIETPFIHLDMGGVLTARKGYCWDGASGPAIDTKTILRGSLFHDCLYQVIRAGLLPDSAKAQADNVLRKICLEDGMSRIRAWWVYTAVKTFGKSATSSKQDNEFKEVFVAP